MTRKEQIIASVKDLVTSLVYYDRKEDEDLPVGAIELAIDEGEITIDEMVEVFRSELKSEL